MLGWPVDDALPTLPPTATCFGYGPTPRGTLYKEAIFDWSAIWFAALLGGLIWVEKKLSKNGKNSTTR